MKPIVVQPSVTRYRTNPEIVGDDHTQEVTARQVCSDDGGLFIDGNLPSEKIYLKEGQWLVAYQKGFVTALDENLFHGPFKSFSA